MRGLEGNFMAQPRVFAHDAKNVTPGTSRIANTEDRGVCLYVGDSGDVEVIMEGGTTIVFTNVPSGSFLPILVTHVLAPNTTATGIIALY